MAEQNSNRFEVYTNRRKAKKIRLLTIIFILTMGVIAYSFYSLYKEKSENLDLRIEISSLKTNNTIVESCNNDLYDYIKSGAKVYFESDKYSLFFKFLIFMGFLYLIQIGISGFIDIVEVVAFGFISIRGLFRLPKKIVNYFKNKSQGIKP